MSVGLTESEIKFNDAKALEAKANADSTNLDFVNTQTGVTHAQELERQKAQSEANQNLAITKALVTHKKQDTESPDIDAAIGFNTLTKAGKL